MPQLSEVCLANALGTKIRVIKFFLILIRVVGSDNWWNFKYFNFWIQDVLNQEQQHANCQSVREITSSSVKSGNRKASIVKKPYQVFEIVLLSITCSLNIALLSHLYFSFQISASACLDFEGIFGAWYANQWSSWEFQVWSWAYNWWFYIYVLFCWKWFSAPHANIGNSWGSTLNFIDM